MKYMSMISFPSALRMEFILFLVLEFITVLREVKRSVLIEITTGTNEFYRL